MTRIQSSVGLVTGIPIQETVDALMKVAARPRNLISDRTQLLQAEKLAVTQLTSLLVAFQFETNQLGAASLFDSKQVSSSKTAAITATLTNSDHPVNGNYLVTPVQTASAQQLLSQSFLKDAAIGAGSFTFQTGGFLDKGISLDELNGGAGVERGKIRITDQSGANALIDLSYVRSVDDVLKAISENTTINVTAVAAGDAFKLIDNTGGSGTLSVQDVAGGRTAADLGLAGISVAAAEAAQATGSDVFSLHANSKLSLLNDATGVQLRSGNDLQITLADQSTIDVDLGAAQTLGDVLAAINAAAPTKLSATIAADGNRIELSDLTTGGGTFAVADVGTGTAATDLGLTSAAAGDMLSGRRLVSGLRDTLVSSLKAGQGLGMLGTLDITNRSNVASQVDLSAAETIGQIVAAINDQAIGVSAAVNSARNGIVLTDTTGATLNNLTVSDGDANNSATALGIVVDAATAKVNGGSLNRRQISAGTLLSSLNSGNGIQIADFTITDSAGQVGAVDLNPSGNHAKTIGDVIDRINALANISVEARINDTGDGIVLIHTAGGAKTLTVKDVGTGTAAKDLGLRGTGKVVDVDGTPRQTIDGTSHVTVTIDEDDTLADLVNTINGLDKGITASLVNDSTGQRLAITAAKTGAANELLFDTTGSALVLQEVSPARDALLLYGAAGSPGAGVLVSSANNTFQGVVDGVTLTVKEASVEPVTITVAMTSTPLVHAVREFVDAYNSIRETLDQLTEFDPEELTTGILFGTNEALRVETELSRLLTARFFGVGNLGSLEAVGVSITDTGQLEFDQTKFANQFAADPEAVKSLFTHETLGVAAKFSAVVDRLAGVRNSALSSRLESLTRRIENNQQRIESMDEQLARQRERLLTEFFRIESVIAKLQQNLTALASLQIVPPLTSQQRSSLVQ